MGRTLVCADLHGRGDLWDKIKEFLKSDDILYMLGDAGDRGNDSWRVLKEAVRHPQVIYILGNHDMMLMDSFLYHRDKFLWFQNGGQKTWTGAKRDPEARSVINALKQCPYHATYVNKDNVKIYLNHSGCVSDDPIAETWDRRHYISDQKSKIYDIIIHGHTPIDSMIDDLTNAYGIDYDWEYGKVCYYLDRTKINIDCGAYWEDFTIILDLDTFEEYVIGTVNKERAW